MNFLLSESDKATLQRLINWANGKALNTTARAAISPGVDVAHELAPEVYVARTPAGGIPALDSGVTAATYTGTGTGTGTNTLYDDVPGSAECYVWQVIRDSSGIPYLQPLDAHPLTVLNMSDKAVDGDKWILVVRDKPGEWWAVTGSGGGGLDVCGNPDGLEDGYSGTGTGTVATGRCPVRTDNERNYPDVSLIKYDQDSFQVTPGGECGRDDSDLTGTGTSPDERKVTVRTVGHTGEIQVGLGDPVICDTLCVVAETKRYLCVVAGLVYGYYDGESAAEQCDGGGT